MSKEFDYCTDAIFKAVKAAALKRMQRRNVRERNLIAQHRQCCVARIDEERRKHNNQLHLDGKEIQL